MLIDQMNLQNKKSDLGGGCCDRKVKYRKGPKYDIFNRNINGLGLSSSKLVSYQKWVEASLIVEISSFSLNSCGKRQSDELLLINKLIYHHYQT